MTVSQDLIREPALLIGGEWVPGDGAELEIEDPARERTSGVIVTAGRDQVDAAIDAANRAFPAWAATSPTMRADFLRRLLGILTERADRFAEIVTLELGVPARQARRLHVDVPIEVVRNSIDALLDFRFEEEIGHSRVQHVPVGVVAAITPWNLPLHQVITKVVPALAAGTTIILKPASMTPLAAYELARAIQDAGAPAGVFNLITGSGGEIGDQLISSPGVAHVSFTGSTSVGRRVAVAAAESFKRVTLELGGKSASIVLAGLNDDELRRAVKITFANCMLNAGQTCTALSRLIVPAGELARVEQILAESAEGYTVGERVGPLASAAQRESVRAFMTNGSAGTTTLVAGGADAPVPDLGYYVAPTVYSSVDPSSRLAQEEVFGPVLAVIPAADDDDAVRIANDTAYGLGGAVWGPTNEAALAAATRLEAGQVDVNGAAFNPRAPFGGFKNSGIGREIGDFGIAQLLELRSIQVNG